MTATKDISGLAFRPVLLDQRLAELFEENVVAKLCRTATKGLEETHEPGKPRLRPSAYPETVPQEGPSAGHWELREPKFWTCGFFPGSLYAMLERAVTFPHHVGLLPDRAAVSLHDLRAHLAFLCELWSNPLHEMAHRTDTHDVGFIMMPALKRDWELHGNQASLQSIAQAAKSLASRYSPTTLAIRSWDTMIKKDIEVRDMDKNFLVIIDSLCNLDLLFYVSAQTQDRSFAQMAATHARTVMDTHLRPEPRPAGAYSARGYHGQLYSTCHVANFDPRSGRLQWRKTAQGYADNSTWARGQAWAVLGYAETYVWSKDAIFLRAACGVAEYFILRLEDAPSCVESPAGVTSQSENSPGRGHLKGRYVPLWDFDAPVDHENPLRDTSAGLIAANGMLILSQALRGCGEHHLSQHFLEAALKIVQDTIDLSLATERAELVSVGDDGHIGCRDAEPGKTFEGIIKNATANNNENALRKYANHTLVYGDYYLIEFGNRLLKMGLA